MEPKRGIQRYKRQSIHYLGNAFSLIEAGDAEKASEFLWGSMAQALKAVAASRGIPLRSHRAIWDYAEELARRTGDRSIFDVFRHANSLHSNFYESGLELRIVAISAEDIRSMVGKLLGLISATEGKQEEN